MKSNECLKLICALFLLLIAVASVPGKEAYEQFCDPGDFAAKRFVNQEQLDDINRGDRLERDWDLKPGQYREEEGSIGIGRLESTNVKDPAGVCRLKSSP